MNKTIGVLGYLLLMISGVYLDAPIIALLAMPLFLTGFILLLKFYLSVNFTQTSKMRTDTIMIIIGTTLLCAVLGYSVVEYNQFQVAIDRNDVESLSLSGFIKIIKIGAVNIIASILIYLGIKKKIDKSTRLIIVLLPTVFLVPATILLLKLTIYAGFWFGG
jgi:hypothetical protein